MLFWGEEHEELANDRNSGNIYTRIQTQNNKGSVQSGVIPCQYD
jgi:hypothetical protein